jgi:hypothetical protein
VAKKKINKCLDTALALVPEEHRPWAAETAAAWEGGPQELLRGLHLASFGGSRNV